MAIEIEMRARFDADTHDRLIAHLSQHGDDLGQDDKHIFFYVLDDQLLKVTDNTAAGTAKISLKSSKIGQGAAFPETDIAIAPEDVPSAVRVFNALGFGGAMHEAFNQRHNFCFRGVEIAVKWSEAWGHHAEFEVLCDDNATTAEQERAGALIRNVAEELGITLMSEEELAEFTAAFEAAQRQHRSDSTRATAPAP